MDAWTLGLSEGLRSWADAGLQFILSDQDVSAYDVSDESQNVIPHPRARSFAPAGDGWKAPRPAGQPRREGDGGGRDLRRAEASPPPAAEGKDDAKDRSAPRFEDSGEALAVFPWDAFRPRLRVPSRSVWTYWDLGTDFGASPDAARRELFATILKHLRWPSGSVTFWPLNFELEGGLRAQPGQFWRGVREARAETVVCFGERAFSALFPRETFSPTPFRRGALTVIPLPGPTAMLGGDAEAKRTVWNTLRSLSI